MTNKFRAKGEMFADSSEVNPMEGVANLADAMLVLAVGIMLALIVAWNVDVFNTTPGANKEDVKEVEDTTEQTTLDSSGLKEAGTVYEDEDGNYYMVKN